jgi:hypothetical protein
MDKIEGEQPNCHFTINDQSINQSNMKHENCFNEHISFFKENSLQS